MNISVQLEMDDNPQYHTDLKQEISDVLSKEIAKEIDFGVMSAILFDMGWHKVKLNPMTYEQSCDIDRWTRETIRGQFYNMGLVWIFEEAKDAMWFTLRWS